MTFDDTDWGYSEALASDDVYRVSFIYPAFFFMNTAIPDATAAELSALFRVLRTNYDRSGASRAVLSILYDYSSQIETFVQMWKPLMSGRSPAVVEAYTGTHKLAAIQRPGFVGVAVDELVYGEKASGQLPLNPAVAYAQMVKQSHTVVFWYEKICYMGADFARACEAALLCDIIRYDTNSGCWITAWETAILEAMRVTSSVDGGEDEIDPRMLVRKTVGGGSSVFKINSKIAQFVDGIFAELELYNDTVGDGRKLDERGLSDDVYRAFFEGLPRGKVTLREFFLQLARHCRVYNTFAEGAALWRPSAIRAHVLAAHPDITEAEFDASVLEPGELGADAKRARSLRTIDDYKQMLADCRAYAMKYEPFIEKSFEIFKRGRAALVS